MPCSPLKSLLILVLGFIQFILRCKYLKLLKLRIGPFMWLSKNYSTYSSLRATTNDQAYVVGTSGGGSDYIRSDDQISCFQSVRWSRCHTTKERRSASPSLVLQTDLLVKIVSVSLGMIDVTSLSYVNSKPEKLIVRQPKKRLMDVYDQTARTAGWLHVSCI